MCGFASSSTHIIGSLFDIHFYYWRLKRVTWILWSPFNFLPKWKAYVYWKGTCSLYHQLSFYYFTQVAVVNANDSNHLLSFLFVYKHAVTMKHPETNASSSIPRYLTGSYSMSAGRILNRFIINFLMVFTYTSFVESKEREEVPTLNCILIILLVSH